MVFMGDCMTIRKILFTFVFLVALVGTAFADIVVAGNGAVVKETFSTATSTSMTIPGVLNICVGAIQECPQFPNVVVKPDGSSAYASYLYSAGSGVASGIAVFDLKTNSFVQNMPLDCPMPRKLALDSTGRLYAPCPYGIDVFSTANNTKLYSIVFPAGAGGDANHVAILNDGTLFTAVGPEGTVLSYAPGAVTPSASIRLGTAVHYFLISPDNAKIFAFLLEARNFIDSTGHLKLSSIVVLDTSLHVIDYVSTGNTAMEFATIAAGRIYAPADNGNLYAIDPGSDAVLSSTFLGGYLTGIALGDDGKLYVAEFFSNRIYSVTVGAMPGSDIVGDSFALPDNLHPTGIAALPIVTVDPIQQLVNQLTTVVNGLNVNPQMKATLLNFANSLPSRIAAMTPTQKSRLTANIKTFISLVQVLSTRGIIPAAQATQLINLAKASIAAVS
jgi:hypothetical protein